MKRISLVALVLVAAMTFIVATAAAQTASRFSEPILIGGDDPADPITSDAQGIKFFGHPRTQAVTNFTAEQGKIELEEYMDVYVDDVVATPGRVVSGSFAGATDPMVDRPDVRASFGDPMSVLNGLGLDDGIVVVSGNMLLYGYEYKFSDSGNKLDRRLILGDIRAEESGEFAALFGPGVEPLETFLIGTDDLALIGNAAGDSPYDAYYPSNVISDGSPFQYCMIPETMMPKTGYAGCSPSNPQLGSYEFPEILSYDAVDIGNGLVAPVYDTFLLSLDGEEVTGIVPLLGPPALDAQPLVNLRRLPYNSPLALFRKVGVPPAAKYRLAGYTSWELPRINYDNILNCMLLADVDCILDLVMKGFWPFAVSNWIMPAAMNPVSIEAVNVAGASSWPLATAPNPSPAKTDFPDQDLAVAYQQTIFDLDDTVVDIKVRPMVMGLGHKTYRDMLGVCDDPYTCGGASTDIDAALFPDNKVALLVVHRQPIKNQWEIANDTGEYKNMNPSHVFEPTRNTAMVGTGMYDTAVLTDYPDSDVVTPTPSFTRAQSVLVPSGHYDGLGGVIYLVKMVDPPMRVGFRPLTMADYPSGGGLGGPCSEAEFTTARPTPLILPELIRVPQLADNYVPYEVNEANINGDKCEDFLVTWRGKDTIVDPDPANPDQAIFDNGGGGQMFSPYVTVGIRSEIAPDTCSAIADIVWHQVNVGAGLQIASATAGKFLMDGEGNYAATGLADIVAGNAVRESNGDGTYSAYAYLMQGGATWASLYTERFRMGFNSYPDVGSVMGVARIDADNNEYGLDALSAVVDRRPLMLADIGCPDYSAPDDPTVASVFETYTAIFGNIESWSLTGSEPDLFEVKFPFKDATDHLVPPSCAEQKRCEIVYSGVTYYLPFYADDDCCLDPCDYTSLGATDWETHACGKYIYDSAANPGYMKWSCQLGEYSALWLDCDSAENLAPSIDERNEAIAGNDDRGGDSGGDTDYAANFRPDEVWGYDGGAIASRAALTLAADARTDGSTKEVSDVRKDSGASLHDLLIGFVDAKFGDNPQFQAALGEIIDSEDFRTVLNVVDENLIAPRVGKFGLYGPALSFEEQFFLMPMYWGVKAGAAQQSAVRTDDSRSSSKSRSAIGCSLIPMEGDATASEVWGRIVSKLTTFVDWVTDLFVPSAGALCGDGIIELGGVSNGTACAADVDCPAGYECGTILECVTLPEGCEHNTTNPMLNSTTAPYHLCTGDPACSGTYTCSPYQVPGWECKCYRPQCGDGCISTGEACDPNATNLLPNVYGTNNGCPAGQTCDPTSCACIGSPTLDLSYLKLPQGKIMPGEGGTAAVVRVVPNLCNPPDGVLNPGEQCDMFGTMPDDPSYAATVNAQCNSTGFGPANVCEINCTCFQGLQPEGLANNDCSIHCDFPDENIAFLYQNDDPSKGQLGINAIFRQITGRTDDFVCPEQNGVTILCRVDGAAAPELSASLSGTPLPAPPAGITAAYSASDNLLPYEIVQDGGSIFEPMPEYLWFTTLEQPVRLVPVAESDLMEPSGDVVLPSSVIMPTMSASVGAVPMAINAIQGPEGAIINGMYEHRVYAIGAADAAQLEMSVPADMLPGTAVTIHEIKMQAVNTGGSWVAVEGAMPDLIPAEDRIDWPQLRAMMQERVNVLGGARPTAAVYVDPAYPVVPNQRYSFNLYQEKYAAAGDETQTVEMPFGFIVGPPMFMGRGGGCACFIAQGAQATASELLPAILAMLVPAGGIAFGHLRRRRRR